jgi:hypothetical protein
MRSGAGGIGGAHRRALLSYLRGRQGLATARLAVSNTTRPAASLLGKNCCFHGGRSAPLRRYFGGGASVAWKCVHALMRVTWVDFFVADVADDAAAATALALWNPGTIGESLIFL